MIHVIIVIIMMVVTYVINAATSISGIIEINVIDVI